MNHVPNGFRSAVAGEQRPLTRRAQAKLQTRDKVLAAAKRLFIDRGYEAATIRDIAQEAGMSTGAVFANFTDKNHLFHEVIKADVEALSVMGRDLVRNHSGSIEAVLGEFFTIGYRWQLDQLPLLQAAKSLSWSQGLEGDLGERPQYTQVVAFLRDLLHKAIEREEIAKDAEIDFLAEMLWEAYNANYRGAVFDNWDEARLRQRIAKQVKVILAGVRL